MARARDQMVKMECQNVLCTRDLSTCTSGSATENLFCSFVFNCVTRGLLTIALRIKLAGTELVI